MIYLFISFSALFHSEITEHGDKLKCQWATLLNHRYESLQLSEVASGEKSVA